MLAHILQFLVELGNAVFVGLEGLLRRLVEELNACVHLSADCPTHQEVQIDSPSRPFAALNPFRGEDCRRVSQPIEGSGPSARLTRLRWTSSKRRSASVL